MGVPQYTTPVFTLTFPQITFDLREVARVYVTFSASGCVLTKTGEALTLGEKTITVNLTQEETAKLYGNVRIQANWTDQEGNRTASEIVTQEVTENLLKAVIP